VDLAGRGPVFIRKMNITMNITMGPIVWKVLDLLGLNRPKLRQMIASGTRRIRTQTSLPSAPSGRCLCKDCTKISLIMISILFRVILNRLLPC